MDGINAMIEMDRSTGSSGFGIVGLIQFAMLAFFGYLLFHLIPAFYKAMQELGLIGYFWTCNALFLAMGVYKINHGNSYTFGNFVYGFVFVSVVFFFIVGHMLEKKKKEKNSTNNYP